MIRGSVPRFIREFQRLAKILSDIAVVAPSMAKTKAWIIRHGLELGVGCAQKPQLPARASPALWPVPAVPEAAHSVRGRRRLRAAGF